jgi:hypothetical protein
VVFPSRLLFFVPLAVALGQNVSPEDLAVSSTSSPNPITAKERVRWVMESTVGPASLAAGLFSAGWGTLADVPSEYGSHWEGFGKRYGMRFTGIAAGNVMEVELGAIWGEDPRYVRKPDASFATRLGHILVMTFVARNRDGRIVPAYARYIAVPGNNFLSNSWRADSEATVGRASLRTGLGFLGRAGGNAFEEFWPDVRQRFFSRKSSSTPVQRTLGTD